MEQAVQKIRFKYGAFELELEGPLAYEQFKELQASSFGGFLSTDRGGERVHFNAIAPTLMPDVPPAAPPQLTDSILVPLSDLAVRDVAKSEREWVLVYALNLTERDKKQTFSTADIWSLYKEAGRENHSRQANLSSNITRCVKSQWLTKLKEDTYALAPTGRTKALEIAARPSAPRKTERKPKEDGDN